ncbi:hypothetical protein ACHAWU_001686 [Discostella pseudostelligera]|uniref:HSF-type DNA-binding domain-containing protein n=1 Tax=Discostella pseudostelligera TaxID=259834 RepID=A0ABD3ME18_9STRA
MTKTELKRSVVDHTYRDYSQVMLTDSDDCMKQWNADLFPAKLHKILSTPEYAHIITWKPHGRAWEIVNRSLFLEVVVPRHFHHANFGSFNRSVNGWGFKRLVAEGPDHNSYYHELFLRGKPELTSLMARLINPGKRLPNKADEPDFYAISDKYPLPVPLPSLQDNNPAIEDELVVKTGTVIQKAMSSEASTPSSAPDEHGINRAASHAPAFPVSKGNYYSHQEGSNYVNGGYNYHSQPTTYPPQPIYAQHPNQMQLPYQQYLHPIFAQQPPPQFHLQPPPAAYSSGQHPATHYAQYPPQYHLPPSPTHHHEHYRHAPYYPQPYVPPSPSAHFSPPIINRPRPPPGHHAGSYPNTSIAWNHNQWNADTMPPGAFHPTATTQHHENYHPNATIPVNEDNTYNPVMAIDVNDHDVSTTNGTCGDEEIEIDETNLATLGDNGPRNDYAPVKYTLTEVLQFDEV